MSLSQQAANQQKNLLSFSKFGKLINLTAFDRLVTSNDQSSSNRESNPIRKAIALAYEFYSLKFVFNCRFPIGKLIQTEFH